MMETASQQSTLLTHPSPVPSIKPALALIVLAPVIAEVLSGSTHFTFIFVLIPEMMVWGCGALIIRELVRRWGGGAASLVSLGLALSIAEEFLIQQTSVAPLPWLGSAPAYGREWGVNWIYFLFMLAYESVWVVVVPIQLTELLFPSRRRQLWLRTRGMIVASLVFLLGSFFAWFLWTQRARPLTFHVPPYQPSRIVLGAGALAIALLAILSHALRNWRPSPGGHRKSPAAWLVALAALGMGFPWYALMGLIFAPTLRPHATFWLPMVVGMAWAMLAFLLFWHWSTSSGWGDVHRWAAVFAATLVCMVAGYLGASQWPRIDVIAKVVMNVLAVIGFLWLGRSIRRVSAHQSQP